MFLTRYHEDQRLLEGNAKYDFWYKRGMAMLNVNEVTADDAGCYTCVATSSSGQSTTIGELHVTGKSLSTSLYTWF